MYGEAEDAAYSVAEAAGIVWVTPHIWQKEKKQVNAEQARAILAQALKDETNDQPIPEDDKKAIEEANELVEMARVAWDQHVRGPEIKVLLDMASGAEGDDAPKQEQPPEQEEKPEEDSHPQEDLSQIEPWKSYDTEKVSDIIAGVNAAVKEYVESELTDLMANIWAYEAAHKNRTTILNHLEEVARRLKDEVPPEDSGPKDAPEEQVHGGPAMEEPTVEREQDIADGKPKDDPLVEEIKKENREELTRKKIDEKKDEQEGVIEPEESPVEDPEPESIPKTGEVITPTQDETAKSQQNEDSTYQRLIEQVESELARDRLHVPKPLDESVPNLPWDWTKMSDKELQSFYGIYSNAAYYKGYQLAREERMALHCKQAADEMHNALLVSSSKIDENGKEKRVAVLEAEIESDENVKAWRRRQRKHETFAASHKNERDSMGKIVEALSRHETMRHEEWERSGGKVGRRG